MLKKRRSLVVFMLLFLLSIITIGCGSGASKDIEDNNGETSAEEKSASNDEGENITLRFAHEEGPGDVMDLYVNKFKDILEEKTDGRIAVDVYTYGQLGTNVDLLKSLESGAIEFSISSPGITGSIIPENQLMAIPFIFSDSMEVNKKVLDESVALNETLAKQYESKGIQSFNYWTTGFMHWTANKPLKTPEDMKNFKMRTMASPLLIESYKVMGANPTPTDAGEIYTSLQMKMVEGQENALFYTYNNNFHEVQDYLMLSGHHIYTTVTVGNKDFFESLSSEDQQLIQDTLNEVTDWVYSVVDEEEQKALKGLQEADIEILELTSEERAAFKETSLGARDVYVEEVGGDAQVILETLEKEIEEAEQEILK
ncbi:TRAP transporter substrate-binding protein DctP [Virgibacillus sp. W0430]|uniref:TRAP transporter substrate-binding protein DctP n=1 Tax=Virgibacillus sp. W0430 TaxID=3391580 RepID=UPI003F46A486